MSGLGVFFMSTFPQELEHFGVTAKFLQLCTAKKQNTKYLYMYIYILV